MQFALVDDAVLVHVHELDGILDGQDVVVALAVDLVDHGRQRCGFAGASWSRDQHQTARLVAQLAHHGGQAKLVERLDLEGNQTKHGRRGATLVEHVGAEAGQAFQSEGEVEFEAFLEAVLLGVRHDAVGQLLGLGGSHLRKIQRHQVPVDADLGRRIGGDVEIAAIHLQHAFQQIT